MSHILVDFREKWRYLIFEFRTKNLIFDVIFLENHIKYTIFDRRRDRPRIVQGKYTEIICDQLVRNSALLLQ
jgi:hypothetical protein